MRYLAIASLLSLTVLAPSAANAGILTKCGASKGTSYFLPKRPRDKSETLTEWQEDGISKGSMMLVLDGTEFDIVYTDIVGTRSSRADGFTIIRVPGSSPGKYLLIGVSKVGAVEHWLFDIDERGNGIVVWGTIRSGVGFQKSSLMKADCVSP